MRPDQEVVLLNYLQDFRNGPSVANAGDIADYESFDRDRIKAIPELRKVVDGFLSGKINIREFKEVHDQKSREFPYWGFGGFSGQMQLNQFANNIEGAEKESVLREAIKLPTCENEACEKIDALVNYIVEKRANSSKRQSLPRPASAAYVLTYFWEIQDHAKWPVYYNSSKKVLEPLGMLKVENSEGANYLEFIKVMREIAEFFKVHVKNAKIEHPFWFVEHVLWKPFVTTNTSSPGSIETANKKIRRRESTRGASTITSDSRILSEWLPPVIADLNELAFNRETAWSKRNGLKPEKALETKLRVAFTLLGYEATELGQGTGRQPDGFAISLHGPDGDYGLVYDAKAREERFSVGTSDREMYEYIRKRGEELRRQRVNRYYFVIISSDFDQSGTAMSRIRDVFRRTRIPIVMIRATDILFLIEEKLKDTDLTHDRLEQLFLETGVLTREKIIEILGIR